MKKLVGCAALLALLSSPAFAQGFQRVPTCGTGSPGPGASPGYQDTTGNECVTTTPAATTYQGTMTLAAATSTALTSGNVTMAPNSPVLPASFTLLTVINTGSNDLIVCQFGGTCSATAGGETLKAGGGGDTFNISPASVPTFFSTVGTTVSFRNGS